LAFDTSNQLFTFTKPKTNTNMPVVYYNVFLNGGFDLSFSYALIGNVVPTLTNTYGNMYSDNILLNGIYNVSSSTTSINGNGNIYQSFNSSGSNYWYVSNTGLTNTTLVDTTTVSGEWLQIKLPCRLKMTSFQTVGVFNSPSSFILAGSNTGTTWDKLLNYNVINVVGGTSYSIGSTTYVKFTGSGTIRSAIPLQANIILVAGGGSGGGGIFGAPGGGGGAGGVAYGNIDLQSNFIYNINIGVGGSGYLINKLGSTGGNTYINELSANYFVYGGGGGGSADAYYAQGWDGGCGGGTIGGSYVFITGAVGGGVLLKGPYNKLSYLSNVGGYYGGGGAGGPGSNISTGGGGSGYKWIDGNTVSIGGNTGSTSVNTNGANSTVYGGGGGGGSSNSNNPGGNGGNGSPGVAIFAFNTSSIIQSISGFINQPIVTSNSYAYYRIICTAPLTGNVALSQINFTGVPDSFSLPNVNGNTYTVNANYGPNRESSKSNSVTAVLTVPTISSIYYYTLNGYIRFQINSVPPTNALPYNINNVIITPMPSPSPRFFYASNAITLYDGGFLGDTSYNFSLNASYDSAGNSAFSPIITSRYTMSVPTISTITNSLLGGNIVFSINSVLPTGASNYTLTNVNISPAPSPTPLFSYSSNVITLNGGFLGDTSYNFRLNASYGFGGNSAFSPIITSRYTLTVPTISTSTYADIDTGYIRFQIYSVPPTGALPYNINNVMITPMPSPPPLYYLYLSNAITLYNGGFLGDTSYNFSLNASYGSAGNSAFSPIITSRYTLTVPTISSITSSRIGGNIVFSFTSALPTGASNYTLTNVNISPAPSPTPLFSYSSNIITLNSGFLGDTSYNFSLNASYGSFGNSAYSNISIGRYVSGTVFGSIVAVKYYPFKTDMLNYASGLGVSDLTFITPTTGGQSSSSGLYPQSLATSYTHPVSIFENSLYNSSEAYNKSSNNLLPITQEIPYLNSTVNMTTNGFTVCFWFKTSTAQTTAAAFSIANQNFPYKTPTGTVNFRYFGYVIRGGSNNRISTTYSRDGNLTDLTIPTTTYVNNVYTHYAITISSTGNEKYYVNAVKDTTVNKIIPSFDSSNINTYNLQFFVGCTAPNDYYNNPWICNIKEFYIYNGELSQSNITDLYNKSI